MSIKKLREQTNEEIATKIRDLKHDGLNMRIQQASGQLENTSRRKEVRREIARLETILSERRLNLTVGKKGEASADASAKKPAKKTAARKKAAQDA